MIEPLYHQVVAGLKTQTRRSGGLKEVNDQFTANWHLNKSILNISTGVFEATFKDFVIGKEVCTARYRVGEVLYLKEPIFHENWTANGKEFSKIHYKFDNSRFSHPSVKWQNKLFMPASAARAFIKITGIRCERLLDISEADCVAEGVEMGYAGDQPFGYINYLMTTEYGYDYIDNTPHQSFISLYKLANKLAKVGSVPPHGSLPTPPGVDNIWVWVYEFEYLKDYKHGN